MRFKVGDVVVFARAKSIGLRHVGKECTIMEIQPRAGTVSFGGINTADGDYLVDLPSYNSKYGIVDDWQLDPKRPPLGSWQDIQAMVKWNPNKQEQEA